MDWNKQRAYELGQQAARDWMALRPDERLEQHVLGQDIYDIPPSLASRMNARERAAYDAGYTYALGIILGVD